MHHTNRCYHSCSMGYRRIHGHMHRAPSLRVDVTRPSSVAATRITAGASTAVRCFHRRYRCLHRPCWYHHRQYQCHHPAHCKRLSSLNPSVANRLNRPNSLERRGHKPLAGVTAQPPTQANPPAQSTQATSLAGFTRSGLKTGTATPEVQHSLYSPDNQGRRHRRSSHRFR